MTPLIYPSKTVNFKVIVKLYLFFFIKIINMLHLPALCNGLAQSSPNPLLLASSVGTSSLSKSGFLWGHPCGLVPELLCLWTQIAQLAPYCLITEFD